MNMITYGLSVLVLVVKVIGSGFARIRIVGVQFAT